MRSDKKDDTVTVFQALLDILFPVTSKPDPLQIKPDGVTPVFKIGLDPLCIDSVLVMTIAQEDFEGSDGCGIGEGIDFCDGWSALRT